MTKLNLLYFSPTGTSQTVVREISTHFDDAIVKEWNLTPIANYTSDIVLNDGLTIIAMPVYAGRLPEVALDVLPKVKANGLPAVVIAVYGNREYEDALLELKEESEKCGFEVMAAAAFIGEHSYSSKEKPIAINRPDIDDRQKCADFAALIKDKINRPEAYPQALMVPGNHPYKERNPKPKDLYPSTNTDDCSVCGECVSVCPTSAIQINNTTIETNGDDCIWCCACVKSCPEEARIFNNPVINAIQERLYTNCQQRKEPAFFL